jgi:hypothetical protein
MDDDELHALDDPAFINERHRVHVAIATTPDDEQGSLRQQYKAVEEEFLRRCRILRMARVS